MVASLALERALVNATPSSANNPNLDQQAKIVTEMRTELYYCVPTRLSVVKRIAIAE